MQIGGLQKLTLIDFPGCLAATVFLTGCDFRCPFCYSAELVLPQKIKSQPKILQKELFNFLKDRKGLLEGVVICGGEPTINRNLAQFIKKIKDLGYLVKLDTNGSNPVMLKTLIGKKLIDYVAMDVKAPKEKYKEVVGLLGCWTDKILRNIEKSINILKESKIDFEFRTTVIPNLLKKEDILKIAHWIKPAPKYFLQNFKPEKTIDPKFEKIKPYPQEYLLEIQKAISPFFDICQIR
ncbi:MAG: anaerobic ribonucleoside-triphosphate reductase activating protein [Candidatus Nealsonbacteria bacterium]|nr:MAG: anaerobic ribonucleoside-triphosphate reductase activating protein [Candidatus Nealsonbacteria bacterium]